MNPILHIFALRRMFFIMTYCASWVMSRCGRASKSRSVCSIASRKRAASSPYSVGIAFIAIAIFLIHLSTTMSDVVYAFSSAKLTLFSFPPSPTHPKTRIFNCFCAIIAPLPPLFMLNLLKYLVACAIMLTFATSLLKPAEGEGSDSSLLHDGTRHHNHPAPPHSVRLHRHTSNTK